MVILSIKWIEQFHIKLRKWLLVSERSVIQNSGCLKICDSFVCINSYAQTHVGGLWMNSRLGWGIQCNMYYSHSGFVLVDGTTKRHDLTVLKEYALTVCSMIRNRSAVRVNVTQVKTVIQVPAKAPAEQMKQHQRYVQKNWVQFVSKGWLVLLRHNWSLLIDFKMKINRAHIWSRL